MANYDPWRLRPEGTWHSRPRMSRLANVMYAHLSDPDTQKEMAQIAKNEGKRPPIEPGRPVKKDIWKLRTEK
jgi:hypothetical protein